jgi:predicted transcriptional regulator YheO
MARARGLGPARREHPGKLNPATIPHVYPHQVDATLDLLRPLVDAIGKTVGLHCEVVLHDLRTPERSIVAIANGTVTGRRVGGPVIGGPSKDVALKLLDSGMRESVLSVGYKTRARDGRELRSTSLVLRTPDGKPAIALCINVDLSAVTMARLLLDEILKNAQGETDAPREPADPIEVSEVAAQVIQETLQEVGRPPEFMERESRLRAVRLMHERGLFLIRGGVERAAAALKISKFTLYSYLKEVRNK